MKKQNNKNLIKLSNKIFIIGLIVLIQSVGFVLAYKNTNLEKFKQESKISNLINEIGELKQQNEIISQKIKKYDLFQSITANTFNQIDQSMNNLTEDQLNNDSLIVQLEKEKQTLSEKNQEFQNLLNQKEQEIETIISETEIEKELIKINENTESYLLLGTNQNLTDTIIIAIASEEQSKLFLLSIPRDLYVNGRKINELYSLYGVEELKKTISNISGLEIEKYAVIDFDIFTEIIDQIGGIDVMVEDEIIDHSYPGPNHSYITVNFKEGLNQLDGKKALQYARSRKSTSDFDRAERQQAILIAVKNKINSSGLLRNIDTLVNGLNSVFNKVDTNIGVFEFIEKYDNFKGYAISSGNVLSTENYLYSTKNSKGQFILLPISGNFNNFKTKIIEML
ncbi:hypothetical protein GF376_00105 [Candidatus Peregrinibacteria bacterium]|nr:hypothetical protein [Candidatus Peregrinibacteria bacterium]